MQYAFTGDLEALLGWAELEVGMSFLLPGMIAKPKDIHDTASRTNGKRRTVRHMLSQPHPGVVLEINRQEGYIRVAMTRTFASISDLSFMNEEERRFWAPVAPALWEPGVDALFNPPLQSLPVAADPDEPPLRQSWVYLGKIFKYWYNTSLVKEAKGPLRQRFAQASVDTIITGLQQCNAMEEDVKHRLALELLH